MIAQTGPPLTGPEDGDRFRQALTPASRQVLEEGTMTQPAPSGPLAQSFAEHLRAFHAGLPLEEQQLLEKLLSLAEAAAQEGADTEGFMDAASKDAAFTGGLVGRTDVSLLANQVLRLRR
jgi:hypothetical protein